MPRLTDPLAARLAAAIALTLAILAGCVSVAPPSPALGPTAPPTGALASATPAQSVAPSAPASSAPSTASPDATDDPAATPGPQTPGPTVAPELAQQIDAVNAQVPPIRQLEPTRDVPYEFITRESFRDSLLETVFEDTPREWIEAEERLLKRMGLVPADEDLLDLILELYGAAVAAYYQPDNGRFYIIQRDAPFGPTDKITVAHEYTHALQDQHFNLEESRIKDLTAGDAILAQLAVIEGDATLTSQQWLLQHLTEAERLQLLEDALGELDEDVLGSMPIILRRQLEFPYGEGFQFIDQIWRLGGYEAVNEAHENPPASTEQVLHIDKYYAGEEPIEIVLEDVAGTLGEGWSRTYEQTIGELGTQVFVGGGERPVVNLPGLPVEWPHADAAAGWGGDRLNMYEHEDGRWAVVWRTEWDTPADLQEFEARLDQLPALGGPSQFTDGTLYVGSDSTTLEALVAAAP